MYKRITLGLEGITELENILKDLQKQIDNAPKQIVETMCNYTAEQMQSNLSSVTDEDGNRYGTVETKVKGRKQQAYGTTSYGGLGAMFLEFGTGMIGKGSPHPNASEVGWEYYIDSPYKYTTKHTGEMGWWHNRKFYVGIPSGRIAQSAIARTKEQRKTLIREGWKKAHG